MQETALDRAFYDTGCASVLPTFQPPWTHRTAGNGMENIGIGEASAVRRNSHGAPLVASSSAIRYNVRDENESAEEKPTENL